MFSPGAEAPRLRDCALAVALRGHALRLQAAQPDVGAVFGKERLQQPAEAPAGRRAARGLPIAGVGELRPPQCAVQPGPVSFRLAVDADCAAAGAAVAPPGVGGSPHIMTRPPSMLMVWPCI